MPPYNKSPPSILSGNHSSDFYFCNSAFSRSYLYQFPKSAETKCQKIGDLNNTNLLSQSPRCQKPVTAISRVGFFGEQWQKTLVQAAFLGVQMAISSLCLHIIFLLQMCVCFQISLFNKYTCNWIRTHHNPNDLIQLDYLCENLIHVNVWQNQYNIVK